MTFSQVSCYFCRGWKLLLGWKIPWKYRLKNDEKVWSFTGFQILNTKLSHNAWDRINGHGIFSYIDPIKFLPNVGKYITHGSIWFILRSSLSDYPNHCPFGVETCRLSLCFLALLKLGMFHLVSTCFKCSSLAALASFWLVCQKGAWSKNLEGCLLKLQHLFGQTCGTFALSRRHRPAVPTTPPGTVDQTRRFSWEWTFIGCHMAVIPATTSSDSKISVWVLSANPKQMMFFDG